MWDDIYSENFVDTLLLLAIPGLSIAITLVVVLVNLVVKRRQRKRQKQLARLQSVGAQMEEAIDDAETRDTRIKFGMQQSVSVSKE